MKYSYGAYNKFNDTEQWIRIYDIYDLQRVGCWQPNLRKEEQMNTDSGNIYESLAALKKGEKEKGIKVNEKHLIRFGLGDTMEWRGARFEIIEIKPNPENILVLHALEKGIY